jgi:hypothetical protein
MIKGTESSLPMQCCRNMQYSKNEESSKNYVTRKSHVLLQIPLKFCHDINFALLFFFSLRSRTGAEKYLPGETLLHATLHTATSVGPLAESFVIGLLLFGSTDQFLTFSLSLSLSVWPIYVSHRSLCLLYVN